MTERTIAVTGVTGQQGGATLEALLASRDGWRLRAVVRNPDSDKARAIASRGVEVVRGDLNDPASMRRAIDGAYGVYSVQSPQEGGPEGEERQGKTLAAVAREAGVSHFVYSSVAGADRRSGVPHFESKRRVEEEIERLGLSATFIRPVLFMDNFGAFAFRTIMLMMLKTFVPDGRKVQMVATRDIGRLAARAFADPDRYVGQAIELAGDAVTRPELVRILRANGERSAISIGIPGFMRSKLPREYCIMMRWIAETGFDADLAKLRREDPSLMTVPKWAASL